MNMVFMLYCQEAQDQGSIDKPRLDKFIRFYAITNNNIFFKKKLQEKKSIPSFLFFFSSLSLFYFLLLMKPTKEKNIS